MCAHVVKRSRQLRQLNFAKIYGRGGGHTYPFPFAHKNVHGRAARACYYRETNFFLPSSVVNNNNCNVLTD